MVGTASTPIWPCRTAFGRRGLAWLVATLLLLAGLEVGAETRPRSGAATCRADDGEAHGRRRKLRRKGKGKRKRKAKRRVKRKKKKGRHVRREPPVGLEEPEQEAAAGDLPGRQRTEPGEDPEVDASSPIPSTKGAVAPDATGSEAATAPTGAEAEAATGSDEEPVPFGSAPPGPASDPPRGPGAELEWRPVTDHPELDEEDLSIYVVQPRMFSKRLHLEVTPELFIAVNHKYIRTYGASLAILFHLRENLALEATGTMPMLTGFLVSGLVQDLLEREALKPPDIESRMLLSFGTLSLQYTPLSGKAVFLSSLVNFGIHVSVGAGVARLKSPCLIKEERCETSLFGGKLTTRRKTKTDYLVSVIGGGVRGGFYGHFVVSLGVRVLSHADKLELRNHTETAIRHHVLLVTSIGLIL